MKITLVPFRTWILKLIENSDEMQSLSRFFFLWPQRDTCGGGIWEVTTRINSLIISAYSLVLSLSFPTSAPSRHPLCFRPLFDSCHSLLPFRAKGPPTKFPSLALTYHLITKLLSLIRYPVLAARSLFLSCFDFPSLWLRVLYLLMFLTDFSVLVTYILYKWKNRKKLRRDVTDCQNYKSMYFELLITFNLFCVGSNSLETLNGITS